MESSHEMEQWTAAKDAEMDFTAGTPQFYLLAATGLLLLTAYWRGRQVRV